MKKFEWNQEEFDQIDWDTIQTFIQTLLLEQKVSFIKYSHKWRLTNKKLTQMEYTENENPKCILCGEIEHNDHPF